MDKKLVKGFNEQLNFELYSAYIYLSMSAYFNSVNLAGFAHWMKTQAKEESEHAMKFYEFLNDRGQSVVFEAIPKPHAQFSSALDVFKKSLEHEQKVTSRINSLYAEVGKLKDNAAAVFLQWFISEQVEEEKNVAEIIAKLSMIKEAAAALLMLDGQLGSRGKS